MAWKLKLWRASNELEIQIDFKETVFFTPFAIIFIIHQIENYKNTFLSAVVVLENYKHLIWPERMGFFAALSEITLGADIDFGKMVERATLENKTSERYLPVTTLHTRNFFIRMATNLWP